MAFNKEFALKLIEDAKSKLDTGQIFQSGSDEIAYYEWMICHNIISVTKHPGFYKTPIYIVHSIMPDYEERINKILGENRVIVSNIPGTRRDAIGVEFEKDGQKFIFTDTAGLRKRGKIDENIERYSSVRSLLAVDRSDVVVIMILKPLNM